MGRVHEPPDSRLGFSRGETPPAPRAGLSLGVPSGAAQGRLGPVAAPPLKCCAASTVYRGGDRAPPTEPGRNRLKGRGRGWSAREEGGEPQLRREPLHVAPRRGARSEPPPGPQLRAGAGATRAQRAGEAEGGRETRRALSAGWICPSARPGPSAVLFAFKVPIQSDATSIYTTGKKSLRRRSSGLYLHESLLDSDRPRASLAPLPVQGISGGGAGGPHWGSKGGLKEQLPAQWRGVSILQEKWCSASWASAREAREEAPSLPAQQRTLPRPCPPPPPFPGRVAPSSRGRELAVPRKRVLFPGKAGGGPSRD